MQRAWSEHVFSLSYQGLPNTWPMIYTYGKFGKRLTIKKNGKSLSGSKGGPGLYSEQRGLMFSSLSDIREVPHGEAREKTRLRSSEG